jgi:hypothetical protein
MPPSSAQQIRAIYVYQIRRIRREAGDGLMHRFWTRDLLTRRIDRCYLIAAGARRAEKRIAHLELARRYRELLATLTSASASPEPA